MKRKKMENNMVLRSSVDDFMRIFEDNLSRCSTQKSAYEATERAHQEETGSRHYSDFSSFYRVRHRRETKKRKRAL